MAQDGGRINAEMFRPIDNPSFWMFSRIRLA